MATDEPLIGTTVANRFRVTGFIGEGAMASVFRANDLKSDGDVAIKVMHPHLVSDRTFGERFRREARAASQLSHPHVVEIVDVGEDDGILYIAMELLAGRDLQEILVLERRIGQLRAIRFVQQICSALTLAHKRGIVHRDLKPENIMIIRSHLTDEEHVKVLDFGIAKIVASGDGDAATKAIALTRMGMVVGTPTFMSPEQCRGVELDGRSDLYTCGVLLYQLVTGALPFYSKSPFETASLQVRATPKPPRELHKEIHPNLEALILRLLAKSPDDRPASAEALVQELIALEPLLPDDLATAVDLTALPRSEPMPHEEPTPHLPSSAPAQGETSSVAEVPAAAPTHSAEPKATAVPPVAAEEIASLEPASGSMLRTVRLSPEDAASRSPASRRGLRGTVRMQTAPTQTSKISDREAEEGIARALATPLQLNRPGNQTPTPSPGKRPSVWLWIWGALLVGIGIGLVVYALTS